MRNSAQTRSLLQVFALIAVAVIVGLFAHERRAGTAKASFIPDDKPIYTVTKFDKSKTWPSLVLVPEFDRSRVTLSTLEGRLLHSWPLQAERARLLPNGNLLTVRFRTEEEKQNKTGAYPLLVREYNWEGDLVWSYDPPGQPHHDVQRLPNGNTLVLWRRMLPIEAKASVREATRRSSPIREDIISEVTPEGKTTWQWESGSSLDINSCGRIECYSKVGTDDAEHSILDWLHSNTIITLPENHWATSGDARFTPGNIVYLPRNWSTVFIIDKATKKIVWEYAGDYKGGLSLPHEAHMIPEGLPGAGNILILDNGEEPAYHNKQSFLLEVNPQTKKVVWSFDRGDKWFSRSAGSLQRLPNGNTFVSDDRGMKLFEVAPSGEIVWHMRIGSETRRATRIPLNAVPQLKGTELP